MTPLLHSVVIFLTAFKIDLLSAATAVQIVLCYESECKLRACASIKGCIPKLVALWVTMREIVKLTDEKVSRYVTTKH